MRNVWGGGPGWARAPVLRAIHATAMLQRASKRRRETARAIVIRAIRSASRVRCTVVRRRLDFKPQRDTQLSEQGRRSHFYGTARSAHDISRAAARDFSRAAAPVGRELADCRRRAM